MLRKFLILLTLLLPAAGIVRGQQLVAGVDFDTFFDNREYSGNRFSESETYFSARLTPRFAVGWEERNSLTVAVDLLQDFGDGAKFLTEVKPQFYYTFRSPRVFAAAGIFPRAELIGSYSELFYDHAQRFYDNRITGVLGHYRSERGYAELAVDWEGMRTETTREKFRILSAGAYTGRRLYAGYALSLVHFAKSKLETPDEGVVDNIHLNPYAGVRFAAFFDFDIRAGYVQGIQRDRRVGESHAPKGGELLFSMSRWGLSLRNHLYAGENQMPFWNTYGTAVYSGSSFYSTDKHIYNRTSIDYEGSFFHDTVRLRAGFVFHYDGVGVGVQQVLQLSVRLQKTVYDRAK